MMTMNIDVNGLFTFENDAERTGFADVTVQNDGTITLEYDGRIYKFAEEKFNDSAITEFAVSCTDDGYGIAFEINFKKDGVWQNIVGDHYNEEDQLWYDKYGRYLYEEEYLWFDKDKNMWYDRCTDEYLSCGE